MEIIGQRLRGLRTDINLSQAKIAEMIGTVQSNINKYETNKSIPPPSTLLWYADFFLVSLDYIYGRTDNPAGAQYSGVPDVRHESGIISEEVQKFVEMCFDPDHPMSSRMKVLITRMLLESKRC